jgi:pilus assembly protein CpaE
MAVVRKNVGGRAPLKVVLAGAPDSNREMVAASLRALSDPQVELSEELPEAPDSPAERRPDVAILLFNGDEESSLALLRQYAERASRPPLIALVEQRSQDLMRRALRAGADELLFMPLDPSEASRALLKISEALRPPEHLEGGTILSLVSTVGGVGVSSLTANLALALRHTFNKRVVAVDLDLQTGVLADYLNLDPEQTIGEVCAYDRTAESIQLEAALAKHPSGVSLLAAPKHIQDAELIDERTIGEMLDVMRQLFDFVLVDCGGYIAESAVAAWEHSDQVLYVLDQSILAARCAWRFMHLFERLALPGVEARFVLNRYHPRYPITERQIVATLGKPIFAQIPDDEATLGRVHDLWQAAPSSPLARAIQDLARRLSSDEEPTVQRTGGLIASLRSALRRKVAPPNDRGRPEK